MPKKIRELKQIGVAGEEATRCGEILYVLKMRSGQDGSDAKPIKKK